MASGTQYFDNAVNELDDASFAAPTALAGWTGAHVISHVASNADALGNLLRWARTGIETPMYASADQRQREIDSGAAEPPSRLRDRLRVAHERLAGAMDALPRHAWHSPVRTAQGRTVPASETVWMRTREVWVHADDLRPGAAGVVPDEIVAALLADALATISHRDPAFRVSLSDTSSTATWHVGDRSGGADIDGTANALLRYVLRGETYGLSGTATGDISPMPRWL
jgi:maleylpyruvate isomerase